MIEVQEGILINPDMAAMVAKKDIRLESTNEVVFYTLEITYSTMATGYQSLHTETFKYKTEEERDKIYRLFYNATKKVSMANTVTTTHERHWDL